MGETSKPFEEWAIVEIMGHQRYAGKVTEQTVAGTSLLRIDVPGIHDDKPEGCREPFTKLFGAQSIFCITPVSEAVARAAVLNFQQRPMSLYDIRSLQTQESQAKLGFHVLDDDEDRDEYDDENPGF